MSKLAKKPISILEGATIVIENNIVKASGPKGSLSFGIPDGVDVAMAEGRLTVSLKDKKSEGLKPVLGLTRAMVSNMVTGVSKGFEKRLELSGVGYRAQINGRDLSISVGFSHPVIMKAIEGITFSVAENIIIVSGADKDLVGNMAAKIRFIRPPEPYKGKGIKYQNEKIRRKVGKAAKALGTK